MAGNKKESVVVSVRVDKDTARAIELDLQQQKKQLPESAREGFKLGTLVKNILREYYKEKATA